MSQVEATVERDVDAEDEAPFQLVNRRSSDDTELDMTPMIDMTFQLLIFFLVTFKSDPSSSIPLPGAKFGVAVPSKNAVIVSVQRGEGNNPAKVYRGFANDPKNLIPSTDLKEIETALDAYISSESERADKTMVVIQAGKDVKHRDVANVAKAVANVAQIQQLYVAVLEVN